MRGLYIHIPFCAQACSYCNFHFSTSLSKKQEVLAAIKKEVLLRQDGKSITSIYFGGGTPSILSIPELEILFQAINDSFDLSALSEVTFELNPEDVDKSYLNALSSLGVNRLSLGIQSFFDHHLKPMNRIHNADQGRQAIEWSLKEGFESLTIDLIYGLPWSTRLEFQENLDIIAQYPIPHLSAYALTVEPKTALAYKIEAGKEKNVNDDDAFQDFSYLQAWAKENNYEHYEISNFAKPGKRAVHNSNYWEGHPYLGIGPGAHSFDGNTRSWNIANNVKYLKSLVQNKLPREEEVLTQEDIYNEWIMMGLRRVDGVHIEQLSSMPEHLVTHFHSSIKEKVNQGILLQDGERYFLSSDQRFFADGHASDLFHIE